MLGEHKQFECVTFDITIYLTITVKCRVKKKQKLLIIINLKLCNNINIFCGVRRNAYLRRSVCGLPRMTRLIIIRTVPADSETGRLLAFASLRLAVTIRVAMDCRRTDDRHLFVCIIFLLPPLL